MAKTINGIKVDSTTISASFTDGGVTKTASASIEVVKAAGSVSTIPVKAVYKRVSGSWVQQDMTTAFSTSGRYIKSN